MHPNQYAALFPAFPRRKRVFVAMSFDDAFQPRWNDVLSPAIRRVEVDGERLEPFRVDARKVSDSIVTEIMDGISSDILVLADVTTIASIEKSVGGRTATTHFRNANVMYEVGLAQALRLPEEVLLFRSDNDPLLFDLSNVRIVAYDPDGDPEAAIQAVKDRIVDAIAEIDLRRNRSIEVAASRLDIHSWKLLTEVGVTGRMQHPETRTVKDVLANTMHGSAIGRLLDLGAIRTAFLSLTAELYESGRDRDFISLHQYEITSFGKALWRHIGVQMIENASPGALAMIKAQAERVDAAATK